VYGIEGRDFSAGDGLSAEVEQAVAGVVAQVIEEVEDKHTGGTPVPLRRRRAKNGK